jgi:hypothetical protein
MFPFRKSSPNEIFQLKEVFGYQLLLGTSWHIMALHWLRLTRGP